MPEDDRASTSSVRRSPPIPTSFPMRIWKRWLAEWISARRLASGFQRSWSRSAWLARQKAPADAAAGSETKAASCRPVPPGRRADHGVKIKPHDHVPLVSCGRAPVPRYRNDVRGARRRLPFMRENYRRTRQRHAGAAGPRPPGVQPHGLSEGERASARLQSANATEPWILHKSGINRKCSVRNRLISFECTCPNTEINVQSGVV